MQTRVSARIAGDRPIARDASMFLSRARRRVRSASQACDAACLPAQAQRAQLTRLNTGAGPHLRRLCKQESAHAKSQDRAIAGIPAFLFVACGETKPEANTSHTESDSNRNLNAVCDAFVYIAALSIRTSSTQCVSTAAPPLPTATAVQRRVVPAELRTLSWPHTVPSSDVALCPRDDEGSMHGSGSHGSLMSWVPICMCVPVNTIRCLPLTQARAFPGHDHDGRLVKRGLCSCKRSTGT